MECGQYFHVSLTPASFGRRRLGILKEREPPEVSSLGVPAPSLPHFALGGAVDASALSFLVRQSLLDREKEKRKEEEEKEMAKCTAAQAEGAEATDRARLLLEQAGKRRKRKWPKFSSSCSSRSSRGGRAADTQKSGLFSSSPSTGTCTLSAFWFECS